MCCVFHSIQQFNNNRAFFWRWMRIKCFFFPSVAMEHDRRLELIDLAIQKLIHDNNSDNLKDHDAEYQHALSHLLSVSQEMLKRDETLEQSEEASSPSEVVGASVTDLKTESENADTDEKEEIMRELKKVKRQNFVTHCLLSVMIVLTVAWQLSEVSLILKVKDGISNPFRSFGNILKGMVKEKVADINGHEADNNKEHNESSSSLPSLKIPEMPQMDVVPYLGKE